MQHFDRIYRSAAKLDTNAGSFGPARQNPEQSNFRIWLALYRASDIQNTRQALELDRAVHAKIRTRAPRQCAIEADIHGDRPIDDGSINSSDVSFGGSVVCIDRGFLSDGNIFSLSFLNLYRCFQMRGIGYPD